MVFKVFKKEKNLKYFFCEFKTEVGSESGSNLAKFATQEEAWRTEQVLPLHGWIATDNLKNKKFGQ